MNEMGRGKKDEGETRLIHDSDVVRQGFLKRMKNGKFRFFALWQKSAKGEARIEYYEDKNKLEKPHKVFLLKEVFRVSVKQPCEGDKAFALHTNEEIFRVSCQSHEEMRQWVMDIMTTRPHGADMKEIQQLGHVMAWRVIVLAEGMSPIFRFQRNTFIFVLDEFTFSLVNPDDHTDSWQWIIKHIRNCGNENNCFTFEAGRRSFSGCGRMWLQMSSTKVATEAHHTVLEQMRKCVPDQETEAQLTQHLTLQQKRLDAIGGRQRVLSAPTEPTRSTSLPHVARSQTVRGHYQSDSIQINPPNKRQPMPLPVPSDDPVCYVDMHPPPRQRATQVSKFARQKSLPGGYTSSSGEHTSASPRSNSTGSNLKRSQTLHPVRATAQDSQSYMSGPDRWQGTGQFPRSNVFLDDRRHSESVECPEDDSQDPYIQPNSLSVSPVTPGSFSMSPQLNSIDGMTSPPEKILSPQEIRQQRIRNHHYEVITDSGVSGVASHGYSIEDQLENMSLQGPQSYEPMSLDRISPQRETQPICVNASKRPHERCRMMSPVTDSRNTDAGYEVMELKKPSIPSYENHPANSTAVEYDVPVTSPGTAVQ